MEYKVLIIDDEKEIAESIAEYFTMFDIKTAYETEYQNGLQFLAENDVKLLLLDINLGQKSGFEFCKQVRKTKDIPILFLSARTSDDDILTALNIGGDDYIKKPFSLNILLAKVKAILHRYEKYNMTHISVSEMTFNNNIISNESGMDSIIDIDDGLRLDCNFRQIIKNDERIKLKEMEFQMLKYLLDNKGRVISKDELLENVWSDNYIGEGTLAVHARHLREKIEEIPNEPKYIKTIWGVGYVFE